MEGKVWVEYLEYTDIRVNDWGDRVKFKAKKYLGPFDSVDEAVEKVSVPSMEDVVVHDFT